MFDIRTQNEYRRALELLAYLRRYHEPKEIHQVVLDLEAALAKYGLPREHPADSKGRPQYSWECDRAEPQILEQEMEEVWKHKEKAE